MGSMPGRLTAIATQMVMPASDGVSHACALTQIRPRLCRYMRRRPTWRAKRGRRDSDDARRECEACRPRPQRSRDPVAIGNVVTGLVVNTNAAPRPMHASEMYRARLDVVHLANDLEARQIGFVDPFRREDFGEPRSERRTKIEQPTLGATAYKAWTDKAVRPPH